MGKEISQTPHPNAEIEENLGKIVNKFPIRHRYLKRWLTLMTGILLVLVGISGAFFVIIPAFQKVQFHSWAILVAQLPLVSLLVCFVLPLGIVLILIAARHWEDAIIVHEKGFIKKHKKRTRSWLWSDIERLDTRIVKSVFGGSEINSRIMVTIEAQNHPPLKIKHRYEVMSELAQEIRKNALPVLYEKFLSKWSPKNQNPFHEKLNLNQSGMKFNRRQLDWHEFDTIETQRGLLIIKTSNETKDFVKIPLNQIHNLDLLLFILQNQGVRENLSS